MAAADYYLCDVCHCKTFYDAHVDYDSVDYDSSGNGVGDMKCICPACALEYRVAIVRRDTDEVDHA